MQNNPSCIVELELRMEDLDSRECASVNGVHFMSHGYYG